MTTTNQDGLLTCPVCGEPSYAPLYTRSERPDPARPGHTVVTETYQLNPCGHLVKPQLNNDWTRQWVPASARLGED